MKINLSLFASVFICILLLSSVSAFDPRSNITLRDRYSILGGVIANFTTYIGDGSQLTGVTPSGAVTSVNTSLDDYLYNGSAAGDVYLRFNETLLNSTIDARENDTTYTAGSNLSLISTVFSLDTSAVRTWLDGIYALIGDVFSGAYADLTGVPTLLSNFTDDLGDRGYTSLDNFTNEPGYSTTTGTVTNVATGNGLTGGPITSTGTISTSAVTAGANQYSYWDGDSWEVRNDDDTTYSAGNGIGLSSTTFSVAGGTALTQDANGLSVTNDAIGDTQLTYNTGQHLTTISDPTFSDVIADTFTGILSWINLTSYPVACPPGTAVTTIGDSSTCTSFGDASYEFGANNFNGSGTFNTTANMSAKYFIGNGSLLTGIVHTIDSWLANVSSGVVSLWGNVSIINEGGVLTHFCGDGVVDGGLCFAIPSVVGADFYIGYSGTENFYIGNTGNTYFDSDGSLYIETGSNVSASNFIGDGSQLTNILHFNQTYQDKADYQFLNNNFNGSGNFTTTGKFGIGTSILNETLNVKGNVSFELGDVSSLFFDEASFYGGTLKIPRITGIGDDEAVLFKGGLYVAPQQSATFTQIMLINEDVSKLAKILFDHITEILTFSDAVGGFAFIGNVNVTGNFTTTGRVGIGTETPTAKLEINDTTTTLTDIIFKASSGLINVTTELYARGTQRWDFTNGAGNYRGSIQYSTPGDNPGIIFRGIGDVGRTDIGMDTQTGGFEIGTGSGTGNPPTQFLIETNNNVSVPLGNFYVNIGKVGIGTTDPNDTLHVNDGNMLITRSGTGAGIIAHRTDGVAGAFLATAGGIQFLFPDNGNFRISSQSESQILAGSASGGSPKFTVLNTSEVGIGTTTPRTLLDIEYTGSDGYILNINSTSGGDPGFLVSRAGAGGFGLVFRAATVDYLGFSVDGGGSIPSFGNNIRMVITEAGNVGIGVTNPDKSLTIGDGTGDRYLKLDGAGIVVLDFRRGVTNGWLVGQKDTDDFVWLNGDASTEFMRIKTSGNIGIGVSDPDTLLEVAGDIHIQGLEGTYTNGEAYVCVYDNGTIFAKDSACS